MKRGQWYSCCGGRGVGVRGLGVGGQWGRVHQNTGPAALLPPQRGKATGSVGSGPIRIYGGLMKICALERVIRLSKKSLLNQSVFLLLLGETSRCHCLVLPQRFAGDSAACYDALARSHQTGIRRRTSSTSGDYDRCLMQAWLLTSGSLKVACSTGPCLQA